MARYVKAFTTAALNIDITVDLAPVSIVAHGLAGVEEIALQYDTESQYKNVPDSNGDAIVIDTTHTMRSINTPGKYRISKPETDGAGNIIIHGQVRFHHA